jgi:dUTP pyrophosphatase
VHPRSGLSTKQGLSLANAEGVIDWDYTNELFIAIINHSDLRQPIFDGERIAQVELVRSITKDQINIRNMRKAPNQKTDRTGGLGHTGKK